MEEKINVTRASMPNMEDYVEKIKSLWSSHWITNMGKYHNELEKQLVKFMGVSYVSLMVNGHMALEMAIQAMDFPENAEIITTPFTFISTTHAIIRNKCKPVFCDIKSSDFTIDEEKIERLINDKTVAIVPVHVYGNICNIERIEQIACKYGLKVIYDGCHSFGEMYKGHGIGSFGDATVFSFHATKVFNTIEGGAVTFSDEKLYDRLYNLKNFGIRGEEVVEDVGANAKMNEFAAIMGLCNLPHVYENIDKRKAVVNVYLENLMGFNHLLLPKFSSERQTYNYGYFPVVFGSQELRDKVYTTLRKENIYARKYFYPLTSDALCFGDTYKDADVKTARDIAAKVLVLPLYPELNTQDVERICNIIKMVIQNI